jgi:hypothetical protein
MLKICYWNKEFNEQIPKRAKNNTEQWTRQQTEKLSAGRMIIRHMLDYTDDSTIEGRMEGKG